MDVLVADKCGFCFGVERAIELARKMLAEREHVYCLGDIIHNRQVVEHLARAGLQVVESLDEIPRPSPGAAPEAVPTVLIRSHGSHPDVIEEIRQRGFHLADATCVLVKRAQKLVFELSQQDYQVVLVGDPEHPEIRGVVGYAPAVTVVASEADVDKLPTRGRLAVVAQTTLAPEDFGRLVGRIATRGFQEIRILNTICRETARRQGSAVELCQRVDVMFVLGGHHSANTRELAQLCRQHGVETYHLQSWDEFQPHYVAGKRTAGVSAGASTPDWIIDEFVTRLRRLAEPAGRT